MSREMTASSRRRPSSPAAELQPLENPDLLEKILLRLAPLPSSLPRASAVCKRWLGLVSEPRFVRRFRARHRRSPPLLGYFVSRSDGLCLEPSMEAPDRVPGGRFTFPMAADAGFVPIGCRHGLMLIYHSPLKQLLVWDPVTGDQHRLDVPPAFDRKSPISAAVLREPAGDAQRFQVVLVGNSDKQPVASVYSSDTGLWGNLIAMTLSPNDPTTEIYLGILSVMVGDSIYWFSFESCFGIIEFDLATQTLALIPMPFDVTVGNSYRDILVMPAEGGGLGFLSLTGFCAGLWKRKKDCDGAASWVLGRSIQLDKLLSLNPEVDREHPWIVGFAEKYNVVLLSTSIGIFTVQLESLQFKKLFEAKDRYYHIHPYEAVYVADKGIDGGHNGAELLQNI